MKVYLCEHLDRSHPVSGHEMAEDPHYAAERFVMKNRGDLPGEGPWRVTVRGGDDEPVVFVVREYCEPSYSALAVINA